MTVLWKVLLKVKGKKVLLKVKVKPVTLVEYLYSLALMKIFN